MLPCNGMAVPSLIARQLTNSGPLRIFTPSGAGPAVQQAHLPPVTDPVGPSELSAQPDQPEIVFDMPSLPDLLDKDQPPNLPAQSNLATAASAFKQKAVQPQAAADIKQEAASSQQEGVHGQAAQGQSAGRPLLPLPQLSAQSTAVAAPSYVPEQAGMGLKARSGPAAAASAAAVPAAAAAEAAGSSAAAPLPRSGPLPVVSIPAGSYAAGSTPVPGSLSCQAPASSQNAAQQTPAGGQPSGQWTPAAVSTAMPTQRQRQSSAPDRVPQQASQQQWRPQAPPWGGPTGLMPYQQPPAMSVTPASGGRGTNAWPRGGLQTPSQQGWQRPFAPYSARAGFGGLGMGRLGIQGMRTVTRVSWPCCRTALGGWARAG